MLLLTWLLYLFIPPDVIAIAASAAMSSQRRRGATDSSELSESLAVVAINEDLAAMYDAADVAVVPSDDTPPGAWPAVRRNNTTSSTTTRRRPAAAAADGDDHATAEVELTECWLCTNGIQPEQETQYGKLSVHEGCKSALRLHGRLQVNLSATAKSNLSQLRSANLPLWKQKVCMLIPPDEGNRDAGLVQHFLDKSEEGFHDELFIKKTPLLTKPRYVAYRRFWDGIGSETASEDWEACIADMDDDTLDGWQNSDGEDRIPVRGNDEINSVDGRRTRTSCNNSDSRAGRRSLIRP